MDFEIEGDDGYDFEDDWKKSKTKKSYFGSDGGGGDDYDFDFGDYSVNSNANNKGKHSSMRQSYAATSLSTTTNKQRKDMGNVSKSLSAIDKSGDDALAKAQSMLNKYSAKHVQKKKPASSMFDFDEDDISVDSSVGASPKKKSSDSQGGANARYPPLSTIGNGRNNEDSFGLEDSALEDSDSQDIGMGLDSGPPMFGDSQPAIYSAGSRKHAELLNSDPVAEKSSKDSIHNDYDDVIVDEPSPYKNPGNYGRTPINNFSIDAEDDEVASYRYPCIDRSFEYFKFNI